MDSLRADTVFAWRRLRRSKITSAAAILSLALAIGACTSAFRLIDALLLRPLPVAHSERLYSVSRMIAGTPAPLDGWEYTHFERMRAAVAHQATLIAISFAEQVDLTYRSDEEFESAHVQYVSGGMFDWFGLRAAAGRMLTENDDLKPGGHPVAILSHDYWSRRFGRDPNVIGRTFRLGDTLYEIVGVADGGFTGTEPGTVVDIFMPAIMHWGIGHAWGVFRIFVMLPPGAAAAPIRDRLSATLRSINEDKADQADLKHRPALLAERLLMDPAAAGVSGMQNSYRLSLEALGILVGLVLLIASANVANLMTAQAAARTREMALRISIGAGRSRLIQMVLVEAAWIALLASGVGALFAWWGAPFVIGMISTEDHPVSLFLPSDWRVLGFGVAMALAVTFLSGLVPALRASGVKPAAALKGGDDRRSRRRWIRALIAVQAAFCFLVLFVAGLFALSFERLSHQPAGISPEGILALYAVSEKGQPESSWNEVTEHLRNVPGVEKAAAADWPILDGWGYRTSSIAVDGAPESDVGAWFLYVSPGMLDVMKIPLINGRDFTETDTTAAIVNNTFAREYFNGENPVGRWFGGAPTNLGRQRFQIVGVVRDARYRFLRQDFLPVAYLPFRRVNPKGELQALHRGTFIVRTSAANPMAMAPLLRTEIPRVRPEFRISKIRTEKELIEAQTVRERLLAMLAMFFAVVALVLAGVGLYGVLNYSVVERRREIGIRMAIGARAANITRLVTVDIFAMLISGGLAGAAMGMASAPHIETLLFRVKAAEVSILMFPAAVLLAAALLAALPAVIHAVRIDPVETLRSE